MAAILKCSSCGREKQVGDEFAGKVGKCPCGERVQAVLVEPEEGDEPEYVPRRQVSQVVRVPWREDNWGIASVVMAAAAIGLATSSSLVSLCAPVLLVGITASLCSRNAIIGAVGLIANIGLTVLAFIAMSLVNG